MTDAGALRDAGTRDAGGVDSGSPDAGGPRADAGTPDAGGRDSGTGDGGVAPLGASVLQHHNHASRDGVYVDPAFTIAAMATLHRDLGFDGSVQGSVYAQPLFIDNGGAGQDRVIVATEDDLIYSLDAVTGAVVWQRSLGTPVALAKLPCGNINPLGVTGTPVVDLASRTLFVGAMTTPDNGTTKEQQIFALSIDDGTVRSGWPVNVNAKVTAPVQFDSAVQNQRGALVILNGTLYVPYGGHYGDCGNYHGWVIGIPIDNPASVTAWSTRARGGGIWAPSGLASDGVSVFGATGNTFGATTWGDGEGILRFAPGPVFSQQPVDFFRPANWVALDNADLDIGGTGPVLIQVPGSAPGDLVVSLGKDGYARLLDRTNLGGESAGGLFDLHVTSNEIINAAAAYTTPQGSFVAFKGAGTACPGGVQGDLMAIQISGSPPTFTIAWCANQGGGGSPMVTTTDGTANHFVWSVGALGDRRLHGFDGVTGAVVFNGGVAADQMGALRNFVTPIAAKGRIFVGGDGRVYAFKP